jgi:hypothetical protein
MVVKQTCNILHIARRYELPCGSSCADGRYIQREVGSGEERVRVRTRQAPESPSRGAGSGEEHVRVRTRQAPESPS